MWFGANPASASAWLWHQIDNFGSIWFGINPASVFGWFGAKLHNFDACG
jgi:hypothetical protein